MTKNAYISTLRHALRGIDPEAAHELTFDITQHFDDGLAEGRSETDIATALGSPRKMAAGYAASLQLSVFKRQHSFANFIRLLRAFVAVTGFNLVLAGPMLVLLTLITTFHLLALTVYLNGALLTSSGITGVDRLVITRSPHQLEVLSAVDNTHKSTNTLVELQITRLGIRVVDAVPPAGNVASDSPRSRWLDVLLGLLFVLVAAPLWNLCARLDYRAILWLASYMRINREIAGQTRGTVPGYS